MREIQVILSMLTIVDNPVQEISLAAAMMSYFGGFTAAELGMVRKLGREHVDTNVHNNLYEHLKAVAVLGEAGKVQEPDVKQLSGKCALFLAKLTEYRDKSSVESLYAGIPLSIRASANVSAQPVTDLVRITISLYSAGLYIFSSESYTFMPEATIPSISCRRLFLMRCRRRD